MNPSLKKRLGEVVDAVSDADPMLMISSPQYREMKAKLNEFAEVYKHTEGDFALKNPDKVREQQKLLCELLLKSTAYLRYKGTKSQKESEKRRIKAAQSIRKFAKRQLLVLDDLNDHCKDLEAALNAERECRRPFNEAGRKMARGFRLSKESDNTITVGKELEAAFADDEEKSIYTRLDLGNPQKEKKRLSAEDKKVVKGLLENLVIRRIIREEQNSAIFDQFKAYRNTLYGSFELVAKMRPLETLKGIIEKTGIINRHLNEMTYEDVTKLIEGKMSRDRSVAAISDDVYVSARDAVLDEKKKIRREMKESGNGTENGNRTGNAKKMGTMEAGSARKSS